MSGEERWSVVWTDRNERLFVERQQHSDVARHRFRSNAPGDGAVVIPTRQDDKVLFIVIYRPVLGRTLIELPRGQAEPEDTGPLDTARRELLEETGRLMDDGVVLGQIYPDSGLSGDGVHVVVTVGPEAVDVQTAEFPDQRWLSPQEVQAAISGGEIRDAITLAALSLWRSGLEARRSSGGSDGASPRPITDEDAAPGAAAASPDGPSRWAGP